MHELQATFGDLVIDGLAWEVRLGGTVIDLTRTEFEILLALASRPRQVLSDGELTRSVWGDGWFGDDNNLAVHVSKLRRKLGESGLRPRFIRTVRGVGYRFDPGPAPDQVLRDCEPACERLRRHPDAVDVRTDDLLRVVSVRPDDAPVFGFDPPHLLGRYFPLTVACLLDADADLGSLLVYDPVSDNYNVSRQRTEIRGLEGNVALRRGDDDLAGFIDDWLVIQRANGQLKQARDYWVLGRGAEPRAPRWSVLHDVLGWGRRPATASATPP